MGAVIAATVFGAIGVIASFFLRPRFTDNALALRTAGFWLVSTPIMFILPSQLTILIACGALAAIAAPREQEKLAAFYYTVLVAVPDGLESALPFPGINYLFFLTFPKALFFVFLLRPLIFAPSPHAAKNTPLPGIFLILLTLLMCAHEFRGTTFTNGLRGSFESLLLYALPFMALIRLIRSREQFEQILAMFVFIAVIFFFVALISQFTRWNFYTHVTTRFGFDEMADFRFGLLRVSVTLNTVLAGFIMSLGLLGVEYFRAIRRSSFITTWMLRGMCVVTAFLTASRGAWLAMMAAFGVFFIFGRMPKPLRTPIVIVLSLVAPFVLMAALNADYGQVDEFGTFQYRRDLLDASLEQIAAKPFFGDAFYIESGRFDHLVTGMGIIDIVNSYVQIALEHGLVGLALFASAFITAIIALLSVGKNLKQDADPSLEYQRAALLGAMVGYLLLIGTTSGVSYVPQIGVMLLAFSVAFAAATRAEFSGRNGSPPVEKASAGDTEKLGDLYA